MQIYLPVAELSLNVFLLIGIGLAIGFLSGMFGVGGGFIMTPLLIFLGVPPGVAVGTGASQVVASSVSSAVGHWQRGNVDVQMGYLLIGGGVFGAMAGVKVLAILKRVRPARPVRLADLRHPARRGRRPDADRERAARCVPRRQGAAPSRCGAAASTPGSRACRSSSASAIRKHLRQRHSARGAGRLRRLAHRPSWASAAAFCWCRR